MRRIEHLHLHTQYSVGDAVGDLQTLADQVVEVGGTALCVTDHGHLYALPDAYDLQGVRFVPGCELYVLDEQEEMRHKSTHLTVLAPTRSALVGLLALLSEASRDHYYYRPRVPLERVLEVPDIVVLSGCINGYCAKPFRRGDRDESLRRIRTLARSLKDRFYLELQAHCDPDQTAWNRFLADLGWPCVVTNDVHYPTREDFLTWRVVVGGRAGAGQWDGGQSASELYVTGHAQMLDVLTRTVGDAAATRAVMNTLRLVSDAHVPLLNADWRVPDMGGYERLRSLVPVTGPRVYRERLEYELELIGRMGFSDFFLLVYDIVSWARRRGYYVSNRGSAVASLVLYRLGVTTLDPIKYNLVFERFLSPVRRSPPDIDLDVERSARDDILDYVFSRWGPDRVAVLSNVGKYQPKLLAHEVKRASQKGYVDLDSGAVLLYAETGQGSGEVKRVCDTLLGHARFVSVHAGGLVFFPDSIHEYTHLYRTNSQLVAAVDKRGAERMGLMKLDLLVVDTLDVIRLSYEDGDPFRVEPDDPRVYAWLRAHPYEYAGLFQVTDVGARAIETIQPQNFEDLMAVVSTIRPGSVSPDEYVSGESLPEPFADCASETGGVLVYQEQRMRVLKRAGFTDAEVEDILRLIKRSGEMPREYVVKWYRRCSKLGVDLGDARYIWSRIQEYGFNRAHAAGYAYLLYLTAWLKKYRYMDFMLALLKLERNEEKSRQVVREMVKRGVRFLPPHVNASADHRIEEGGVRIGYGHVKNVGWKAAELIEANAPFDRDKWQEFVRKNRRVVNARVIAALSRAGALQGLEV